MLQTVKTSVFTMSSYGLCFALVVVVIQTCAVFGNEEIIKSSLTFVIDDTFSMSDEIRQVKEEVNIIFEKVLSSNSSQIDNFVLVTFNDPDAAVRTDTTDRIEFKQALAAINVHGGGNCPEYAMKGIELAIQQSLPLSYLYVFTDASAEDHHRVEQVMNLAQKKQCQVVFVLTGDCGRPNKPESQVYYQVAEATGGQVFHMMKTDVKDILKYIEESITGRGVPLVNTKVPPGYDNIVPFRVDSHTPDGVVIAGTGMKPKIGVVTNKDGSKAPTEIIVSGKDRVEVVKVPGVKPGDYEVMVGSLSDTHVVITAKSSLNFQPGFSVFKPTSIKDTVTKPAPVGKTFLGVRLLGDGVELTSAKILDLSDNVITELPLELVDGKSKFYTTPAFEPPNTMFRVSVSGFDVKTKSPITRTSSSPIERQDLSLEKKEIKSPRITIEGAPTITVDYDAPLQLKCKAHAYPAPDIVWQEKYSGVRIPTTVEIVEVPYDYVSVLNIERSTKNNSYECKASNSAGNHIKDIQVETKRKIYFDVVKSPKGYMRVEYAKEAKIVCKVDAYPPAKIIWYKDGKLLSGDSNVEVSGDKSTVTIKHMQPYLVGKFICEVANDFNRKVFFTKVTIFGVEKPKISSDDEIRVTEKSNAVLSCRIQRGIPKPTLQWFFQAADEKKFKAMKETSETIRLANVRKDQAGSYKCVAANVIGADQSFMELVVEYPPSIKEDVKLIKIKDDEEIKLPCDVTGVPRPTVTWYFNGTKLENSARTRIYADHHLRLKVTLADTGYYTCKAENNKGSARKVVYLDVFVPVNIEVPKVTTIKTMVGKSIFLNCHADGYPKPNIKWLFFGPDPRIPGKDVILPKGSTSVVLKNVQLSQSGFYTCVADNGIGGSANITYEVKVFAPPVIENVYSEKTFEVVEGDLALRIQCRATGSPTPTIIWQRNGLNLALGSDWYDMDTDGTLIIKNIDYGSEGTYLCLAQNSLGNDTELFDVKVTKTPKLERPTSTVFVEEGKSVNIKCDLAHIKKESVRWYKNGVYLPITMAKELNLASITRNDDGLYTCRVRDQVKTRSATTKVVVGWKPKFNTEESDNVEFVPEAEAQILSCEAHAEPKPKRAVWKHNGEVLNTTTMSYPLEMVFGATGIYECKVSNEFGSIYRSFNVTSKDCILDLRKDFPERHPLMHSSSSIGWSEFPVNDGYMVIPHTGYFYFKCPSKFANSELHSVTSMIAFCEGDNKIKIRGRTYNFADIKCNEEVKPDILKTGNKCLPGNTEYIKVGYKVFNKFLEAYEVCVDKNKNIPLYSKQKLSPEHTDSSAKSKWYSNDLPLDFDTLYDCRRQAYHIATTLGRGLRSASCCYGRRQLVNFHDLSPRVPTSASYTYFNVVPHWSTCSSKNWDDVEERVRKLSKTAGRNLTVMTGASVPLYRGVSKDVTLQDGRGGNLTVPPYLWKIVQDPSQSASLAIIQVNIPELSSASEHIVCPDICKHIDWMRNPNWVNVDYGFTYCCTISDFERAFGYVGQFSTDMNFVLFDVSLTPEYYLTK